VNHLLDSSVQLRGHFKLWVRCRGVLVPHLCMDESNLIVNGAKTVLSHLLGGDVTNRSVTTIGYGTSGTAPAVTNTALTAPFTKALDATSYPTTDTVQFAFSLGAGENNPMAISEFGLLTAGAALFSRKVRSVPLNKDSDISFAGTWAITFSV
jgi:hypothetical protein